MMMDKSKKQNTIHRALNTKSGFTLLFAALIGSLVLTVGMAILSITLKQLTLSSAGKATQRSFYSADAGIECALYLDRGAGLSGCKLGLFRSPTTSVGYTYPGAWSCVDEDSANLAAARCMGRDLSAYIDSGVDILSDGSVRTTFELKDGQGQTPPSGEVAINSDMCFVVAVTKKADDIGTAEDETSTIIESRGYNVCNEDAVNRYERAIRSVNQ